GADEPVRARRRAGRLVSDTYEKRRPTPVSLRAQRQAPYVQGPSASADGSAPQVEGPGAGGAAPPRERNPRVKTASVMSSPPSSFESAASWQAGSMPPVNRKLSMLTASVMLRTPSAFESARRKASSADASGL